MIFLVSSWKWKSEILPGWSIFKFPVMRLIGSHGRKWEVVSSIYGGVTGIWKCQQFSTEGVGVRLYSKRDSARRADELHWQFKVYSHVTLTLHSQFKFFTPSYYHTIVHQHSFPAPRSKHKVDLLGPTICSHWPYPCHQSRSLMYVLENSYRSMGSWLTAYLPIQIQMTMTRKWTSMFISALHMRI